MMKSNESSLIAISKEMALWKLFYKDFYAALKKVIKKTVRPEKPFIPPNFDEAV